MRTFKICAFMALVLLSFASCGKKEVVVAETERVEQVKVQSLQTTEISHALTVSTTLQGYETMNVAPSVNGKIEKIFVEEGNSVKKGELLVRMDQMQYKTTQFTYANLGVEMERMAALIKTGSVTQQAYDQLKLSYDQTKENLDFLEKNTYFKAPFAGYISAKNYQDGELYGGQPILQLTQIATLKAEVAIPEAYFPIFKDGMSIDIKSDIYKDEVFKGTVERVFPTIDPASHTFTIKVRIPNADMRLRPGMYVYASIPLGMIDALVVPYQSVLKLQGSNERYVFINDGGFAKRVPVKLGERFDDKIEIMTSEIKTGDQLIVVGQARLVDKVKLNIVE